jgi:hypothetical protein
MNTQDDFNSLPWHDAVIHNILIDREDPGHKDTVEITIEWPDNSDFKNWDMKDAQTKLFGSWFKITFHDCYLVEITMNMGIIVSECIMTADCSEASDPKDEKNKPYLAENYSADMFRFDIETNSTGGLIRIFSKGYTRLLQKKGPYESK